MSKLLGERLTMESAIKRTNLPGPAISNKRTYICRRCHQSFKHYDGVKSLGNGIGLCKLHNPHYKQPAETNEHPSR